MKIVPEPNDHNVASPQPSHFIPDSKMSRLTDLGLWMLPDFLGIDLVGTFSRPVNLLCASHRNHTPKSSWTKGKNTILFWHNWVAKQLIRPLKNTFVKNGLKVS